MSNELLALKNLRLLRTQAREYSLETLTDILDKLSAIVEEHREEQANSGAQAAEHAKKLDKIREMMLSEGIDISELVGTHPVEQQESPSRQKRPAKYHSWTGQGRTPSVIQKALNQGDTLEMFLIKE